MNGKETALWAVILATVLYSAFLTISKRTVEQEIYTDEVAFHACRTAGVHERTSAFKGQRITHQLTGDIV